MKLASFVEGINRAGQLESTCDTCADVTMGSPVLGKGELDPSFPQFHTNSNGLGARHNADQCFLCHAQPILGGSGGFIVPNPGHPNPMLPENPMFRLVPHRFEKRTSSRPSKSNSDRSERFALNTDPTGRATAACISCGWSEASRITQRSATAASSNPISRQNRQRAICPFGFQRRCSEWA
jgi:hypothetical protein